MICIGDDVQINPTNNQHIIVKNGSRNANANANAVHDSVRHVNPYVGRLEKLWMTAEKKYIMCRIRWFLKKDHAAECMKQNKANNLRIYGVRSKRCGIAVDERGS